MSSCGVKRYLPDGKVLYKKAKITIQSKGAINNRSEVKDEINAMVRPIPNSTFFGAKLGLWAYYKAQKDKPNFYIKYLNKKIGEKPAFISDVNINKTEGLIQNRLENRGYYYSKIQLKKNDSTGKITGQIFLNKPYKIKSYQVVSDSLTIYKEISKSLINSKLKQGVQFNLAQLKIERERIDIDLKSKGYYNFNADFLLFEVDTNQNEEGQFNLYIRLKKDVPHKAIIPYQLNKILVYPNYTVNSENKNIDTAVINSIHFIQDTLFFLPRRLEPFLLFEPNTTFNPTISKRSASRLSSIGSYKYVNIQFEENETLQNDSVGKLNTFVYLSPTKKRALRFELQGITKSNSFAGPTFSMIHTNRNLFKGGELINFSAEFGYEKQFFVNDVTGLTSTQLGLKVDLLFPRLLSAYKLKNKFIYSIPKTKISVGIETLNRSQLYRLTSFNASSGYLWNSNKYIYHEINPISVNYVLLGNTSTEFNDILEKNPFLKSSFDQELIAGLTYSFTYTQLNDSKKKNPIFFSTNFDIAGNTLSLIKTGTNNNGKHEVLGIEYAQYAKLDADFRYYLKMGKQQVLVSRLFTGYGFAYVNSTALPFSKQYFSGGPYSVRSFRTRQLGPGTFFPANDNSSFFDQSGDIRLEANLEYRFPIVSIVKGAVFLDGGNIWLRKENEAIPGGKFTANFINELGVGSGVGIRFDIQGFVIRFDFATPIRKPYLPEGERFGIKLNETILNFALGYPF